MAKNEFVNDSTAVSKYIKQLETPFAQLVEEVRQIILSTDPSVKEHVKWNAPAFFFNGKMSDFNAKEYKRDLVVMNLRKGNVLLIFPTGSRIENRFDILEGSYTDGRRMITIQTHEDLKNKKEGLIAAIQHWLETLD